MSENLRGVLKTKRDDDKFILDHYEFTNYETFLFVFLNVINNHGEFRPDKLKRKTFLRRRISETLTKIFARRLKRLYLRNIKELNLKTPGIWYSRLLDSAEKINWNEIAEYIGNKVNK